MALKELPGGELYEENGGSYANEATARRHEAIHRQLGVRGEAAADRAELAAANAVRASMRAGTRPRRTRAPGVA